MKRDEAIKDIKAKMAQILQEIDNSKKDKK